MFLLKKFNQFSAITICQFRQFSFFHQLPIGDYHNCFLFIVPVSLEGGGTIYSNGFFLTIFRRSIYSSNRVETVSLESSSSVVYGIKKIFLFKVFTGSYRGLNFTIELFLFTFSGIFAYFSSILLKFIKILRNDVFDFVFNDRNALLNILIDSFLSKVWAKYFRIQLFHQN